MKKVFFVALILVLVSCNNDKTTQKKENVEVKPEAIIPVNPSRFIVELELKYSESESIRLFANDVFINNDRTMNISLTEKINKSEEFSTIVFSFPENIQPDYQAGISFGTKKVKSIEIKTVHISYGDVAFEVASSELNDYFTFNKFIEYNAETGVIKTKKIGGKLNPLMFLRRKILDSF